ncbi:DUF4238 domain-containing protein, partial [Cronobacter sakazakii]|nr:DUF4238 domain-containing protein [Cronobacter sakazakii]
MNSDNSKKHHYIPQGILNEFSKKSRIWWHSKRLDIQKNQKTKEVAFKKHFYKYPDSDASLEIDFFTKIDSDAPEIIKKIIKHKCINVLSADEKYKLIKYIASQILRTPQSLNFIDQFEKTIKQQIHEDITILKENLKADYLNSILFNTTIHEDILKEKSFLLYKANNNERFIIGDCPVLTFHKRDCVNVDIRYNSFPPVINYDIYLFP